MDFSFTKKFLSTIKESRLTKTFFNSSLQFVYNVILLLLTFGLVVHSGTENLGYMIVHIVSFNLIYLVLKRFFNLRSLCEKFQFFNESISKRTIYVLTVLSISIVIVHFLELGMIPISKAFFSLDYQFLTHFRRNLITEHPRIFSYLLGFLLKGLFPFLLFYYAFKKSGIYWLVLSIALFYALNFLHKSLVIPLVLPGLVLFIVKGRLKSILVLLGITAVYISGLTISANPVLKMDLFSFIYEAEQIEVVVKQQKEETNIKKSLPKKYGLRIGTKKKGANLLVYGISRRVFYIPGMTVGEWFKHVPDSLPYLGLQGYNFLTPITGKPYRKYSQELYKYIYPSWYNRGYRGNVNVAAFMHDYVAFGAIGLILSGFLIALTLIIIDNIFVNRTARLALNTYGLFSLSSTALSITLFSGGWMLVVFLYLILGKSFQDDQTS